MATTGEYVHEKIGQIESEIKEIKAKQEIDNENIGKLRDKIEISNGLITELRIVCERIQTTNENQNKTLENQNRILDELKASREKDKEKQGNYVFWFITTIGGVLITALLGSTLL